MKKRDTRKKNKALRVLNGNASKRKLPDEPKFSTGNETPPDDLDSIGQAEWMRIAPELREAGVLTKMDEAILFAYCEEFSVIVQCVKKINQEGLMVKRVPRSKVLTVSPYLSIKQKSVALLKSLASELGLSPASRSRVSIVSKTVNDPYENLRKRREASLAEAKKQAEARKAKKDKNQSKNDIISSKNTPLNYT